MNIGEAVRLRILDLCRERDLTINKLSNMPFGAGGIWCVWKKGTPFPAVT